MGRTNAVAPSDERYHAAWAAAQTSPPAAVWVVRRDAFDAACPAKDEVQGSSTCVSGVRRVKGEDHVSVHFGNVWLLLMPRFVGHPPRCVDAAAAAAARRRRRRGDRRRHPGGGGA